MQNRFVRGIRYVPTLPTVLSQILALLNKDNSSAQDLEAIITNDQALSSKVLAVANSAYYGFRHQILTVTRAVVALGFEEIRNICLGASLKGFLHPSSFRNQKSAALLWLHSLTVADASALVAEAQDKSLADTAFAAGLLHDLGKVVLAAFFPDEVDALKELMTKENLPYREAEKALDMEHGLVGEALGQHWDLPLQFCEAMGYHHLLPSSLAHYNMAATVHLGDYLARRISLGHSGNPDTPELNKLVLGRLNMDNAAVGQLQRQLDTRRPAIIGLWQTLLRG